MGSGETKTLKILSLRLGVVKVTMKLKKYIYLSFGRESALNAQARKIWGLVKSNPQNFINTFGSGESNSQTIKIVSFIRVCKCYAHPSQTNMGSGETKRLKFLSLLLGVLKVTLKLERKFIIHLTMQVFCMSKPRKYGTW